MNSPHNATPGLAEIAALIGDPARANILDALMDGRALTASELASVAGVAAPTASGHLARLVDGGLIAVARQGRHRYFRLASPLVGQAIESLFSCAAEAQARAPQRSRACPRVPAALRDARTCYDHFAGRLGVAIADGLVARGHVRLDGDGGDVTSSGLAVLDGAGVVVKDAAGRRSARPFCRPCLDWTERRPHLAGQVGAAICARCVALGWVRRAPGSRVVQVTPEGARGLREIFGAAIG